MKTLVIALCVAIASVATPVAMSAPSNLCTYDTHAKHHSVFVVGDSITVMGRKYLPKNWEVNAVSGRPVKCLPSILRKRKADGMPKVIVMALGTNPSKGWSLADYRAAVDMFPKGVRIVLVTPYRVSYATALMKKYALAMHRLAKRKNVYLADWRAYAKAHQSQLTDGTHPNKAGRKAWAKIIEAKVS